MTIRFALIVAIVALGTTAKSQQIRVPVRTIFDSTFYDFYYYQPEKTDTAAKVPKELLLYYTLTRNIEFPALNFTIPVLIGMSKSGVKLIIFDRNHNRDFTDDSIIYFPETIAFREQPGYRSTVFSLPKVGDVEFDYNIIQPSGVLVDLKDSLENKIFFEIRSNQYRLVSVVLNKRKLNFYIFSEKLYTFNRMFTRIIIDSTDKQPDLKELYHFAHYYKPGDNFRIGDKAFLFKEIVPDSMLIEELPSAEVIGTKVGFIAPTFSDTTLDGDLINTKTFLGRYLLLDFWGTWCGPCKVIEPYLKQIHAKAINLKMIGLALDRNPDLVFEHIKRDSITWQQILIQKEIKVPLSELYDVSGYPNLILIDPTGKIIFNEAGVEAVGHLATMLREKNILQ